MKLYILRHAPAVPRGTPGYADDSRRPLTTAGIRKMKRAAAGLRALKMRPDLILSSPYPRARHTAEIAAAALKRTRKLKFSKSLVAEGDPQDVIHELQQKYATCRAVMLVGHEPYLSRLISLLIAGNPGAAMLLKKGGLAKLRMEGRQATLEWLLTPQQLQRLARS